MRVADVFADAEPEIQRHLQDGKPINAWTKLVLALRRGSMRIDGCLVSTEAHPQSQSPAFAAIEIQHAGLLRTFTCSVFAAGASVTYTNGRNDYSGGKFKVHVTEATAKALLQRLLAHRPTPGPVALPVTAASEHTEPTGADLVHAFDTLWQNLDTPFRKRVQGEMVTIMRTKSMDIQVSVGSRTLTFFMSTQGSDRVGVSATSAATFRAGRFDKPKPTIPLKPVGTVAELVPQMIKVVKHGL